MDRYNAINPAYKDSATSDTTVEQPKEPQAVFEQRLREVRQLGPVYSHSGLYDVTEEDDRLIQAASGAALDRGPLPNPTTIEIYDRRLRKLAELLKQSGQSIAELDDDTLLERSKKLLPEDKVIVSALSMVSRYREPSDTAPPRTTHYRPSKEDANLIREATEAGFGRAMDAKTAGNYASNLRKLAAALRPLSIAKLSHEALLGHADALFPKDKKLIYALNRLNDYRRIAGRDNSLGYGGGPRHLLQPTADLPVQLLERGQPLGPNGPLPAAGFNVQQFREETGFAARSPAQRAAQDTLFDAVRQNDAPPSSNVDASVLWQGISAAAPSPLQSFAQEDLFDAVDREGLPPFNAPVLWPGVSPVAYAPAQNLGHEQLLGAANREDLPTTSYAAPVRPTAGSITHSHVQSVTEEEPFGTAGGGRFAPTFGLEASRLWTTMEAPPQSVSGADPFDAETWQPRSWPQGPASEIDFSRMMNQDGETAGKSFDASLAVTEDFSHGTQPAPDMMRSKLSGWGQLPDAAQRVKSYNIHGEYYAGVLGPRGPGDLQLIHLRSPAVGDTFDVSFAVPNDFSHRTQLAPDIMLSELGKWDFLPNAEYPFMNYEIGGERYTAVLGPRGSRDVQLVHRPRFASRSEPPSVTPMPPPHTYEGLPSALDQSSWFELQAANLQLQSVAPVSGDHRLPQVPEIGELFGHDWRHGPREASPLVIDILQTVGLLPSPGVPMTCFMIHGEPYTAESLPDGRVLLFHRPQLG
ncbi:hypothetical protein XH99_01700 [Bradyrhizobium nanningense]|uniref:Type III effector NopAR n=1 Tax=Bradyrhizobium nanningense TaxID=1325118 RepID=A0A4Q0SHT4_9BRAD|nr:hypothetical protein [Bradyrhizobium nanningense]RXH38008.1 hypothetical protein XH99_01700 [Bradyrhizobium nanningense]